ncbi:MAG: hypothetical protein HUU08_10165, partial [Candidatus Brocadia sp.]|nr:hypothetical protein [Candidatus Brocadia sp.]
MTDTSNDKKHTDRLKKKKGWLISFNIAISIVFSGLLVWLLAYTPLVPEKEFHVKLFDFLKYAPYNTSQSREEFKNNLLAFLRNNRQDPSSIELYFRPIKGAVTGLLQGNVKVMLGKKGGVAGQEKEGVGIGKNEQRHE